MRAVAPRPSLEALLLKLRPGWHLSFAPRLAKAVLARDVPVLRCRSDRQLEFSKMMSTHAIDLRKGQAIRYGHDVCVVLDAAHRNPGNLRGFVQASLRSLRSGRSMDVRFATSEAVATVALDELKMDFSYRSGDEFVFSDPETFEQVTIPEEMVGDAKDLLVENGAVIITFIEDKAVRLELPPSVVLRVDQVEGGIRGSTVNKAHQNVVLETGVVLQAPLFVKVGDRIKVDTRTREYLERT